MMYGAYPILWPLPHALVRITGLFDYWRPWTWDLTVLIKVKALKNEMIYMVGLLSGGFISCAYQCADVMIFADPHHPRSTFVVAWVRPVANLIVRRICYALLCFGLSRTSSPQAKVYGILLVHLVLTALSVRLTTSCRSYGDLLIVLLFDWSTFMSRSIVVRELHARARTSRSLTFSLSRSLSRSRRARIRRSTISDPATSTSERKVFEVARRSPSFYKCKSSTKPSTCQRSTSRTFVVSSTSSKTSRFLRIILPYCLATVGTVCKASKWAITQLTSFGIHSGFILSSLHV